MPLWLSSESQVNPTQEGTEGSRGNVQLRGLQTPWLRDDSPPHSGRRGRAAPRRWPLAATCGDVHQAQLRSALGCRGHGCPCTRVLGVTPQSPNPPQSKARSSAPSSFPQRGIQRAGPCPARLSRPFLMGTFGSAVPFLCLPCGCDAGLGKVHPQPQPPPPRGRVSRQTQETAAPASCRSALAASRTDTHAVVSAHSRLRTFLSGSASVLELASSRQEGVVDIFRDDPGLAISSLLNTEKGLDVPLTIRSRGWAHCHHEETPRPGCLSPVGEQGRLVLPGGRCPAGQGGACGLCSQQAPGAAAWGRGTPGRYVATRRVWTGPPAGWRVGHFFRLQADPGHPLSAAALPPGPARRTKQTTAL